MEVTRLSFTKQLTIYASAMVIALVAWILNVQNLYWMTVMLLLLPHVCRFFGRAEHRGLEIVRGLPAAGHQGESVAVRFQVRNRTLLPKLHLVLQDELPEGLEAVEREPVPIPLPPRAEESGEYHLRLRRRGLFTVPGVRVLSTDPLGLDVVESRVQARSQILVYPRVIPLPSHLLPPPGGGGPNPVDAVRRKGDGTSFSGIRDYRPGDPLRHVHWRSAARLRRLAVVEWEAEESQAVLIAVETGAGTALPLASGSTLDLAAGLAASLAAGIQSRGGCARLLVPGYSETAAEGPLDLPGMLEILARMEAASRVRLASVFEQTAHALPPGTVVCWITAAPDEALLRAARLLRSLRSQPVVYALVPGGSTQAWTAAACELQSLGIPVHYLCEEDPVAAQLLG